MNNNLTELVFILDRSGSMAGLEADTIGGFNSLIAKQKQEPGRALISTVLFDDKSEVLYDRVPLDTIEPMTDKSYYVRGCTALLDALGKSIHHIGNVHKYARPEDRPDQTLFIITTDGMENASKWYSYEKIKTMVERQQSRYGWEFIFLGANIDAISVARQFGIDEHHAANYHADQAGTALNFAVLSEAVCSVRKCKAAPLSADWKRKIEEDYQNRNK